MKETIRLSLALGAICLVASVVLALANRQTLAARERASLREKSKALSLVLPPYANDPLEDTYPADRADFKNAKVRFYLAKDKSGKLVAVAGEGVSEHGFGGIVRVLVGLLPDGTIRAVAVTQAKETPGLGTLATVRKRKKTLADLFGRNQSRRKKSALPPCKYLDQYTGKKMDGSVKFKVKKDGGDIQAVTGATISSRAVAEAVNAVAQAWMADRAKLLKGGQPQ